MKRFFFWLLLGTAAAGLAFIGLNLFDSRPDPALAGPFSLAANLEPENGFFSLWGLAEPAETDPAAPPFRARMLELFNARVRDSLFRARYGRWLGQMNSSFQRNWQGAGLNFPRLPEEDICAYAESARAQVSAQLERHALPMQRYQRVLRSANLRDFTPLGWDFPARSFTLAAATARLFAASCALAAVDDDWDGAGDGLFAALAAGMKLIACGRSMKVNSLGKTMVELSLRTLASLLNRDGCSQEFARRVLERLPARPAKEFGTAAARAFAWLNFARALERVKKDQVVDPNMLKDYFHEPAGFFALERFVAISGPRFFGIVHALAAFFLKKNETAAALRSFWENVGLLEETPPASWPADLRPAARLGVALETGPFWWLRNPLGKMMARSAVPYTWPVLQHYVYRSHGLKARYDLVRLLAAARLQAGPGQGMNREMLRNLLASAPERDPFSGKPYLFSPGSGMLYSVGQDGHDDNGREQVASWRDSDIAVPINFVKSEK